MYVKLRYFEQVTIDPAAGAGNATVIRMNSAYDPFQPVGGSQPKGLDQYFALYDKGAVMSSRITVKAASPNLNSQSIFGVSLRNDTGVDLTAKDYIMDPNCAWAVGNVHDPNEEVIVNYTPKWFGGSEPAYDVEELYFTAAADVIKPCLAHCFVTALQSGHDPSASWLQILVEYNVCFFEPNTLPQS